MAVTASRQRKSTEAAGVAAVAAAERANEAAEKAANALERAAETAGQSADAAARSADATERVASVKTAQEQREVAAQKLAKLDASLGTSGNTKQLIITNHGKAVATDVLVLVAGRSFNDHEGVTDPFPEPKATRVGPGGQLIGGFVVFRNPGRVKLPAQVRLEWRDESGAPRDWEGQVG